MEGTHTTAVSSKIFPDVLGRSSVQGRMITGFIQGWDFARSIERQWKRGIDVVMRLEPLPTESKNDRGRDEKGLGGRANRSQGFQVSLMIPDTSSPPLGTSATPNAECSERFTKYNEETD